MMQFTDALVI